MLALTSSPEPVSAADAARPVVLLTAMTQWLRCMSAYANQSISTCPTYFPCSVVLLVVVGGGCFVDRYLQAGAWEFLAKESKAYADLSLGRAATRPPASCMYVKVFLLFFFFSGEQQQLSAESTQQPSSNIRSNNRPPRRASVGQRLYNSSTMQQCC